MVSGFRGFQANTRMRDRGGEGFGNQETNRPPRDPPPGRHERRFGGGWRLVELTHNGAGPSRQQYS